MEKKVFHVEGMMCGHCAARVEKVIKALGLDAKVDLDAKTVEVTGGEDEKIISAIKDAGYTATRA